MSKPEVGEYIIFVENGKPQLAIVTGHTMDNTINIHVFTTSHYNVHPSNYHPLIQKESPPPHVQEKKKT